MTMREEWNGISVPTLYKGIQFRSRLEARWAVFFDELGIEWDYEPETFATQYGYYMPDFYLPSINRWFIVKGTKMHEDERKKVYDLCRLTNATAIIANGSIPEKFGFYLPGDSSHCNNFELLKVDKYEQAECWCIWDSRFFEVKPHVCSQYGDTFEGGDYDYLPCFCPKCGKFDFQYEGRYERNCECANSDRGYYEPPNPKIVRALQKAKTAYFNQETKQFTVRNF